MQDQKTEGNASGGGGGGWWWLVVAVVGVCVCVCVMNSVEKVSQPKETTGFAWGLPFQ